MDRDGTINIERGYITRPQQTVDLTVSYMIGDKLADIEAGHLRGCKPVLLLSGYGTKQQKTQFNDCTPAPDFACEPLAEAIEWIWPQIPESDGRQIYNKNYE